MAISSGEGKLTNCIVGTASDWIRLALKENDLDQALSFCTKLQGEYNLMFSLFNNIFGQFLPHLREMFRENQQVAAEAVEEEINKGQIERAIQLLAQKQEEYLSLHQKYTHFFAALLDHLVQVRGEEGFFKALEEIGERLKPGIEKQSEMSTDEFVSLTKTLHSQNFARFKVEEDEYKFTFSLDPCGTGGKLLRSGFYESNKGYVTINPEWPGICKGRSVPAYCAHCLFWFEVLPVRWFGRPLQITSPPRSPDAPCIIQIYKEVSKIPTNYYGA